MAAMVNCHSGCTSEVKAAAITANGNTASSASRNSSWYSSLKRIAPNSFNSSSRNSLEIRGQSEAATRTRLQSEVPVQLRRKSRACRPAWSMRSGGHHPSRSPAWAGPPPAARRRRGRLVDRRSRLTPAMPRMVRSVPGSARMRPPLANSSFNTLSAMIGGPSVELGEEAA